MRGSKCFALVGLGIVWLGLNLSAARAAEPAASFETVREQATAAGDLADLVLPFVEDCAKARREIDIARCRGVSRSLKATLPGRIFSVVIDDPALLSLTEYDARISGFHLQVAGCLACQEPVGDRRAGWFVTLKEPAHGGGGKLFDAVEVARVALSFASMEEAMTWQKSIPPLLKTEFLFQPAATEWKLGERRGLAFKLVGVQVFNRCSGEVIYARPPAAGPAPRDPEDPLCGVTPKTALGRTAGDTLPAQLTPGLISEAMGAIRGDVETCEEQFHLAGTAYLRYTVAGSGLVQKVVLEGPMAGTGVGQCVLDAAGKIRFPRFSQTQQSFRYPVILRK